MKKCERDGWSHRMTDRETEELCLMFRCNYVLCINVYLLFWYEQQTFLITRLSFKNIFRALNSYCTSYDRLSSIAFSKHANELMTTYLKGHISYMISVGATQL